MVGRTKFKQTEIGPIPEDWELIALSACAKLENGDRGKNYPIQRSDWNGVPFINAGHLLDGRISMENMDFIAPGDFERLGAGKIRPGDILFCLRGSLGKFGVVSPRFGEGAIASSLVIVRSSSAKTSTHFLVHYFGSTLCKAMIEKWSGGAAQPNLGAQDLARFMIAIPPKPEQAAIASALSDADSLIEGLEHLIEKKRQIKKGAMQELLTGKGRLPGFSKPWTTAPLSHLGTITMGQSPASAHYNTQGHGLPLIQGNADIRDRKTIARVFTTQFTRRGHSGDVLLSVRAPVGEVSRAIFDVALGRGMCAIQGTNDFVYQSLIARESLWATMSAGSTFDSVTGPAVRRFELNVPSDHEEQAAIAQVLTDMDSEIEALEQKVEKARAVKQGMMQELLTGRRRLV